MKALQETVEQLVEFLKTLELDAFSIRAGHYSQLMTHIRKQSLEGLEHGETISLSVALYKDKRRSLAHSSLLDIEQTKKIITNSYLLLPFLEVDKAYSLPDKSSLAWEYNGDLDNNHSENLQINDIVKKSKECEQTALDYSKRICNTEGVFFDQSQTLSIVANSMDFLASHQKTSYSFSVSVIAKDKNNNMQAGSDYTRSSKFSDLGGLNSIAIESAKEACNMLGARKIKTKKSPVILRFDVASAWIGYFLNAISGNAQYKKDTFLLDALNKKCAPDYLSISEFPLRPGSLFSSPFDNEGVRLLEENPILTDGVLQRYILDQYYANKLNLPNTGNSGGVLNTSVYLRDDLTLNGLDALIKNMHTGLLVTSTMGFGFQQSTGDWSTGVYGFWVENGEVTYPVEGITVAGNYKDMLMGIQAIANDYKAFQRIQVGSLLFEELSISGD